MYGWLVADFVSEGVLICYSLTTDVCNEALKLDDCSLIVSYHPPVSHRDFI